MNDKKTVTIIDTFGFFFRSFYALPPLSNSQGFPTGLLTGFINFISSLHKEHSSDYLIFALDAPGDSFRAQIDPNYKANRAPAPEDLKAQLPIAIDWIEKMGYKSLIKVGYEADDMIASVIKHARAQNLLVRVVSHDKDLYQLIDDDSVVLVDAISKKVMNEAACVEKYGIEPRQFIDYQALLGDSADNVSGVKGIGKVTATKLLNDFNSLEQIYENLDNIDKPRTRKLLEEGKEAAFISKQLVSLDMDIFDEIDFSVYEMHFDNPFVAIYDELIKYEMNGALRQLKAVSDYESKQQESKKCEHIILDNAQELFRVIDSIAIDEIVAFDTETTGLDVHNDRLVGFSFSFSENCGYYVPLGHSYLGVGEQIADADASRALHELFKRRIVGHNLKFDLHFITRFLGVDRLDIYSDTIIMAWLYDSSQSLSLESLAKRIFNIDMIRFEDVIKRGSTFASLEIIEAAKYASEDAYITYRLYKTLSNQLKNKMDSDTLEPIMALEHGFLYTLLAMEREGIALDVDKLADFSSEVSSKISTLTEQIHDFAGGVFNINSPKQLGGVLFEKLGLPVGKKTKTGYSTDENVLLSLRGKHPIIEPLLEYREHFKLLSTYIEPLSNLAKNDSASRIHTSFNQTGTATGRLSSQNPNLQNIPVRTHLGNRIREAFVAPEGRVLIGIDYSQIELRLLAHFSGDSVLVDAFNSDKDIHMQTAIALFGEDEAPAKRDIAKTVNFGLLYGMGAKKLSDTLEIPQKDAREIIERYFATFPSVKGYFATVIESAKELGYVQTLLSRRRYFDFASASPMLKAAYEREAVNTIFQGSAADLIKLSMNAIDELIREKNMDAKMLLQIHDELIFEADEAMASEYAKEFESVMSAVFKLKIPLKTTTHIGQNWGVLK